MTPVDETKRILYPSNGSSLNLLSYYPYQTTLNNNLYVISDWDVQDTDSVHLDLIASDVVRGAAMSNPKANFVFRHKCCRMELNFDVDPSSDLQISDLEGMTVTIHKQNRTMSYSLLTGALSFGNKYGDPITFVTDDDGLHSHAILPPTPEGEFVPDSCVVNMTLRDGITTFSWFVPSTFAFESGKRYTWNLTMKLGKIETADRYTISAWDSQDVQSIVIVQNDNEDDYIFGAVDLGLPSGTLWATCNIGATAPNEIGDYYAWGELEPHYNAIIDNGLVSNQLVVDWKPGYQAGYDWSNYKHCQGTEHTLTKYVTNSYNGTVDGLSELLPEDDVAFHLSNGRYCIPSKDQIEELCRQCQWQDCYIDGNRVEKGIGPNGNFIVLPYTGFWENTGMPNGLSIHLYWSRTLDTGLSTWVWGLDMANGSVGQHSDVGAYRLLRRSDGSPVRPVVNQ